MKVLSQQQTLMGESNDSSSRELIEDLKKKNENLKQKNEDLLQMNGNLS